MKQHITTKSRKRVKGKMWKRKVRVGEFGWGKWQNLFVKKGE